MSNLPLAILGAASAYFILTSSGGKKKSSTPTSKKPSLKPEDIARGYQIINCKQIVIIDRDLALEYAYQKGIDVIPEKWEEVLFDKCVQPTTQDMADFKFNMLKSAVQGAVESGNMDKDKMLNFLQNFKNLAGSKGINTNKWVVEIIGNDK